LSLLQLLASKRSLRTGSRVDLAFHFRVSGACSTCTGSLLWPSRARSDPARGSQRRGLDWLRAAQGYQLGKTKVFLRAGQMAELDKIRTDLIHKSTVTLQRYLRGWLTRRSYASRRRAIITLQVGRHIGRRLHRMGG
jgi:IQ calmodulin-binding motif